MFHVKHFKVLKKVFSKMFHVKRLKVSYKKILKVRESIIDIKNAKEWLLDILKQYSDCNLLSKEVDKLINEIVIKRVEKCKEQDFENMIQTLPKSHKKHILNVLNRSEERRVGKECR